MNEFSLAKHLIFLFDTAQKNGLLQLESFDVPSNKWRKNRIYAYCLRSVLNGVELSEISSYLQLYRNRIELIIIKGFEFISRYREVDIHDVATSMGSLLKSPKFMHEMMKEIKDPTILSTIAENAF